MCFVKKTIIREDKVFFVMKGDAGVLLFIYNIIL